MTLCEVPLLSNGSSGTAKMSNEFGRIAGTNVVKTFSTGLVIIAANQNQSTFNQTLFIASVGISRLMLACTTFKIT